MDYIKTSKNPVLTRFEFEHEPVTTHTAARAYENVLKYAGASKTRDYTDNRISQAVETYVSGTSVGNGIISSINDVGGYPVYENAAPLVDSDGDGLPDEWEFNHNLNPYDGGDGKIMTKSGYTNLEVYLNNLVDDVVSQQNKGSILTMNSLQLLVQATANHFKKR